MIVITCASGRQASHILPLLTANALGPLRLVVHSSASEERLRAAYPSAQVTRADLAQPTECVRVVRNAVTVYHIGPSFHPCEDVIGKHMVDAALAEARRPDGALQHFVLSSVIQTQLRKLLNHDVKRYVEEYLMESGLNYTILKPTMYMDNFLPALNALVQQAAGGAVSLQYDSPWDASVLFSSIALDDFAEASFKVISERERHYFASYDLASTLPEPWGKRLDLLAAELGRDVRVTVMPLQTVLPSLTKALLGAAAEEDAPPLVIDTAERLVLYYRRRGIVGNPSVLEMVMGRKATSSVDWVKKQVASARLR